MYSDTVYTYGDNLIYNYKKVGIIFLFNCDSKNRTVIKNIVSFSAAIAGQ